MKDKAEYERRIAIYDAELNAPGTSAKRKEALTRYKKNAQHHIKALGKPKKDGGK